MQANSTAYERARAQTTPPTPPRRRRAWTDARRKAQAVRCRIQQPWRKARGPKTPAGKAKSARNAHRHGFYAREMMAVRRWLSAQRRFMRYIVAQVASASQKPSAMLYGGKYDRNASFLAYSAIYSIKCP